MVCSVLYTNNSTLLTNQIVFWCEIVNDTGTYTGWTFAASISEELASLLVDRWSILIDSRKFMVWDSAGKLIIGSSLFNKLNQE